MDGAHIWTLVLGADEHYWSDQSSQLCAALGRAQQLAGRAWTTIVVAEQQRRHWEGPLSFLPPRNVIAQPRDRGTANLILLPLLHILECDPNAHVVVMPAVAFVGPEIVLSNALRNAAEQLRWRFDEILLLGLPPAGASCPFGYVVPGNSDGRGALNVKGLFDAGAADMPHDGALQNPLILAASGSGLLAVFKHRIPHIVNSMRMAVKHDLSTAGGTATAELYRRLPAIDLLHDVLPDQESRLRVLPVAASTGSRAA